MDGFSAVDGFLEITECLADMIKYVANEPSVGHYYIQQHLQNGTPNLLRLKNNIAAEVHEITLHTEDVDDSINAVKSIKGCGIPIVDEMIQDVNKSLLTISSKQAERGLSFSPTKRNSLGRNAYTGHNGEGTSGYFSSVFQSAKQKASNIKWPERAIGERGFSSAASEPVAIQSASTSSTVADTEADELPLSSPITDDMAVNDYMSLTSYDDFKADKEAKLKKWLEETENDDGI